MKINNSRHVNVHCSEQYIEPTVLKYLRDCYYDTNIDPLTANHSLQFSKRREVERTPREPHSSVAVWHEVNQKWNLSVPHSHHHVCREAQLPTRIFHSGSLSFHSFPYIFCFSKSVRSVFIFAVLGDQTALFNVVFLFYFSSLKHQAQH